MAYFTLRQAESLKCAICKCYLSMPPISIISSHGTEQKCGRCKDIKTIFGQFLSIRISPCIRNIGYENLAQWISFPCIYDGCKEKIPLEEVMSHEMDCAYRIMRCPIYWFGCNQLIKVRELRYHFSKYHRKHLFYDQIVSRIQNGNSNVYVLIKQDAQFLVYITTKVRQKKIYVAVFTMDPFLKEDYEFKVKLTSRIKPKHHVAIKKQHVIQFNERQHCRRCIGRECQISYHPYSLENNNNEYEIFKNMTSIDSKPVMNLLGSEVITYTVNITGKERTHTLIPEPCLALERNIENSSEEFGSSKFFRQYLECPICQGYLTPPIYICKTGHTICNICKPNLQGCPICKSQLGETRNYPLESLIENVELRCTFDEAGCQFMGTIHEIHYHEFICEYKFKQNVAEVTIIETITAKL